MRLFTFNAGQGAFHWVDPASSEEDRTSDSGGDGGLVFDCGTMRGGTPRLEESLRCFIGGLNHRSPRLLVISHLHSDHYSGIKKLLRRLTGTGKGRRQWDGQVWLPKIDPHSMHLYLRILAFGCLLRGEKVGRIRDKELGRLHGRETSVKQKLEGDNPGIKFEEVSRVTKPLQGKGWEAHPLTPPSYPAHPRHPLSQHVRLIQTLLGKSEFRDAAKAAVVSMWDEFNARVRGGVAGLRSQRFIKTPPFPGSEAEEAGQAVVDALASPIPESQTDERKDLVLRGLLALSAETGLEGRIDLGPVKSSGIPEGYLRRLRRWDKTIEDATHYFNLTILAREGDQEFLLTGDAHPDLSPLLVFREEPPGLGAAGMRLAALAVGLPEALQEVCICATYSAAAKAESQRVKVHLTPVKPAVLQVPHHGSRENVEWGAYACWRGPVAVVSAAPFDKTWRHPSLEVAEALSGTAGVEAPAALYCTNFNPYSPLCATTECKMKEMRGEAGVDGGQTIDAIVLGGKTPEWLIDGGYQEAEACPGLNNAQKQAAASIQPEITAEVVPADPSAAILTATKSE